MDDNGIITTVDAWKSKLRTLNSPRLVVLTDENTKDHCLPYFQARYLKDDSVDHLSVPSNDGFKTIDQASSIWSWMMDMGVDRQTLLICVGGGMLCDLGGFVASTYKRGIRSIYVPTTNLAMTDAAIGGKTGVNFNGVKNQIGSFHKPEGILVDVTFLDTLPERELLSGFAESIKHALIADHHLWSQLSHGNYSELVKTTSLIEHSAEIKFKIVEQDYRDSGIRQALNFGHTIGHAIEAVSHNLEYPLLHGEAVIIGMMAEAWLSNRLTGLPALELDSIREQLSSNYSFTHLHEIDIEACRQQMHQDKKNTQGKVTCSLIANIGIPVIGVHVEEPLLIESIGFAIGQLSA